VLLAIAAAEPLAWGADALGLISAVVVVVFAMTHHPQRGRGATVEQPVYRCLVIAGQFLPLPSCFSPFLLIFIPPDGPKDNH